MFTRHLCVQRKDAAAEKKLEDASSASELVAVSESGREEKKLSFADMPQLAGIPGFKSIKIWQVKGHSTVKWDGRF